MIGFFWFLLAVLIVTMAAFGIIFGAFMLLPDVPEDEDATEGQDTTAA